MSTPLADVLDVDNLERHVAEGLIASKVNDAGLRLLNYTARAQWAQAWDRETMTCRGLVVAPDGTIQSRPFPKFFNLAEHESPAIPDLPVEPFTVHEKVDGSLIIVSAGEAGPVVTTRGSFDSRQATEAATMLATGQWPTPPEGQTWLMELVAPWNRIVVDYGDRTDLVFLTAIDNATGADVAADWPGAVARTYDGLDEFDAIADRLASLGPNDEGFVLRFASGMRAKAKGAEYVRLHRLLTGVTARTIHECLSNGSGIGDLLERVPDEFYAWVKRTADDLSAQFDVIEGHARNRLDEIRSLPTRKDQALAIKDYEHKGVVFAMLDGKPYDRPIWRNLRPAADLPAFAVDPDEVAS